MIDGPAFSELSSILDRAAAGIRDPLVRRLGALPRSAEEAAPEARVTIEVRDGHGTLIGRGQAPPAAEAEVRPRHRTPVAWCPACGGRAAERMACAACGGTGRAA